MTTSLVIDAGFAYKLIVPGQHQAAFTNKMTEWAEGGVKLYAPSLWAYELTSAFNKAVYFKALTPSQGQEALKLALLLNVQIVMPDEQQIWQAYAWTQKLKRVAAYDSFYLALAEKFAAQFWTTDKRLYNAVNRSWVKLIA